jgi:hypothetical protein
MCKFSPEHYCILRKVDSKKFENLDAHQDGICHDDQSHNGVEEIIVEEEGRVGVYFLLAEVFLAVLDVVDGCFDRVHNHIKAKLAREGKHPNAKQGYLNSKEGRLHLVYFQPVGMLPQSICCGRLHNCISHYTGFICNFTPKILPAFKVIK